MKRIILCLSLFAFFGSQAQQINPVPDYVFSNKMSVGRNAVTDTAAYFSIGPRYGAIRGMMPPMVTDTANMSATKRNGLLIFSIQKNKYLYWDSVGSKWAEMAGTAGSAITGSGVAGYMPEFTTSTNLDTTRLYHSAGRFAIGSTTTTNGVFNVYGGQSYFDTSLKVGSQTLLADEGKNEVYVNTTTDNGAYALQVAGSIYNTTGAVLAASSGNVGIGGSPTYKLDVTGVVASTATTANFRAMWVTDPTKFTALNYDGIATQGGQDAYYITSGAYSTIFYNNSAERMRITSAGELLIGSSVDQGAYALQVAGSIYNTTGAVLAATSGNVGIGTTSPGTKLTIEGGGVDAESLLRVNNQGSIPTRIWIRNSAKSGYWILNGNTKTDTAFGPTLFEAGSMAFLLTDRKAIQFVNQNLDNTFSVKFSIMQNGSISIGNVDTTYKINVTGVGKFSDGIRTDAPSGGTEKPWKLGEVATISPTSPNRTIRVEIDGTVYYIHAKTTND